MKRLSGKVAVVTGAGTINDGIGNGKAVALRFAEEGAKVCLIDKSLDAAKNTRDMIVQKGGEATAFAADVTDEAAISSVLANCIEQYGHVDILHNNVGILKMGGAADTKVEDWDLLTNVNLKAVFLPTKHLLPHFISRQAGVVVNVSSIAGDRYLGAPYIAYSTTKGSIVSYTRTLAAEYGKDGIRANCVVPGFINTPMSNEIAVQMADGKEIDWEAADKKRASIIPLGRVGTPWDVANASLFLASDDASYITGTEICVDGGVMCRV